MKNNTRKICECAILVAMAFVLSLFEIPLAFGGAVTAASMVPLVIASFRNGTRWGIASAFAFSVIQLLCGLNNFSYVTGIMSVLTVLFLDYLIAFTVVGSAGIFAPSSSDTRGKLVVKVAAGSFGAMTLRFICHVISGAVVWYDLTRAVEASDPTNMVFKYSRWIYSIVYNAIYMVPETVLTVIVCVVLVSLLGKKSVRGTKGALKTV